MKCNCCGREIKEGQYRCLTDEEENRIFKIVHSRCSYGSRLLNLIEYDRISCQKLDGKAIFKDMVDVINMKVSIIEMI